MTKQGVQVDYCEICHGIWLDRGEIFHFTKDARAVNAKLHQALRTGSPGKKLSPRTRKPMLELTYPRGPQFDFCQDSGGLWFDANELKALLETERDLRMALDHNGMDASGHDQPSQAKASTPQPRRFHHRQRKLMPLPNLFLRSSLTLAGLYALVGLAIITAVEFAGVEIGLAVGVGIVMIIVQFLLGPFLMDLTLRWLYKMTWVSLAELPPDLAGFVKQVCGKKGIKLPKFGVIDDGAPQAFTYGHTPNNARVVITKGLYDLLEPDELQAVVAHELGHAVHWDILLMTAAQLVPLLLYYVYRALITGTNSSGNNKNGGAKFTLAIAAYGLYLISEFLVLWFSRIREYHADRFAGEITGNPARLANALVKIGYGLAGRKKTAENESERPGNRKRMLDAVGALGIFDGKAGRALALASYSNDIADAGEVNKTNLKAAMRWDLWNPWAKWYELGSTHPLVANRLRYLSNQSESMGQPPYVSFGEARPESYWDEFFFDLSIYLLPITASLMVAYTFVYAFASFMTNVSHYTFGSKLFVLHPWQPLTVALLGLALLLRFTFSYKGGFFPKMSVAALLKRVKVSAIRPVPCTVRGVVIGKGVPGYLFSEDFVLQDDTGIMFLDYRQPLAIWEFLFALLRAGDYQGREVVVEGWYRRSPIPYIEVKSIECEGKTRRSWVPLLYKITSLSLLIGGLVWTAIVAF